MSEIPDYVMTSPQVFADWALNQPWPVPFNLMPAIVMCPMCAALVLNDWSAQHAHVVWHAALLFPSPAPSTAPLTASDAGSDRMTTDHRARVPLTSDEAAEVEALSQSISGRTYVRSRRSQAHGGAAGRSGGEEA